MGGDVLVYDVEFYAGRVLMFATKIAAVHKYLTAQRIRQALANQTAALIGYIPKSKASLVVEESQFRQSIMAESKVILVTGASRGIGYAIAKYLADSPDKHKLVVTARTAAPLEDLKREAPDRVEISTGDFSNPATAQRAIDAAVSKFGRLDGLVLNHGTMGEVKRLSDSSVDGWTETFQVNLFSIVGAVKVAIPHLRKTKGRIILTSSGAAAHAYSTWGAYGASKAAINHLALTLAAEEPDITTVSVRPGVVDSEMQREIRETHAENMDEKDRNKFISSHKEGKLLKPEQPGHVMARLVVGADRELNGKFLSWDDKSLAEFQS